MDSFVTIIIASPIPSEQPEVPLDAETTDPTKQQGCVVA